MAEVKPERIEWRKSIASGTSNCVEVAFVGDSVLVRHSWNPSGPILAFSRGEWSAFVTGVRKGEFSVDNP